MSINQQEDTYSDEELNALIVEAIQDIKGHDIIALDLRIVEADRDYFIICHGESTTQVRAIAKRINQLIYEKLNLKPFHAEGQHGGQWMLLDYFTTAVHVFYRDARKYYNLEELWSDAVFKYYESH